MLNGALPRPRAGPDEVPNGKVKVTVSLTAWKARDVKSSTAEVTVRDKPAAAATKTGDKQER
jgi:hypothetical protein